MYRSSRNEVNDKIERLKQRLQASSMINPQNQQTPFKYDSYEPNYQSPMLKQNQTFLGGNYNSLKDKVQKEVNTKVNLATEKRELELMIQDQIEAQMKLKDEYGRQIDATKAQEEHLAQLMEDIERENEIKMEKRSKLVEENQNLEQDINEIIEENKLLESEIEKMGQRTSQKMGEMQEKME